MPVYELRVSDDLKSDKPVDFVAGVDKPAIEDNFIAFKACLNNSIFEFSDVSEDFTTVFGAVMIPNQLILRKDENGNFFKVFYTAETIRTIATKFFANGFQNNFNLMHDHNQKMDGVTFFQSVIKNKAKGIDGLKDDNPDGTWYLGANIANEEVKKRIKSGEIKGFSIEGFFTKVPVNEPMYTPDEAHKMIAEILNRTQLN